MGMTDIEGESDGSLVGEAVGMTDGGLNERARVSKQNISRDAQSFRY